MHKGGDTRNGQPQIGKFEEFLAHVTVTQQPHKVSGRVGGFKEMVHSFNMF